MYQDLQNFLTFASEAIVIMGYGGIFAHYFFTITFAKQIVSIPSETLSSASTSKVRESTKTNVTNTIEESTESIAMNTVDISSADSSTEPLYKININPEHTTFKSPELEQIEKLTLRQCRAVIRFLNTTLPKGDREAVLRDRIRLKINGKDAPTSWLRFQIKKYLEEHQVQIIPVLEQALKTM